MQLPAKFIVRGIFVVFIGLLALVLNAEGKLLPNETPLLMLMVILFIGGVAALNFVEIQRWRKKQTDHEGSLDSSSSMIVDGRQRLLRKYRRWLFAMPFMFVVGVIDARQLPLWGSIVITAFGVCAYGYVLFLYNRTKRL